MFFNLIKFVRCFTSLKSMTELFTYGSMHVNSSLYLFPDSKLELMLVGEEISILNLGGGGGVGVL